MAYWYKGFAAFVEATASERHAELKERTVISELAIAYLILGGVGAGCIAVCSLLDLVAVRERFGDADLSQGPAVCSGARMIDYSFALGFAVLGAGASCLIFDLGRLDRMISLFVHPSLSWMTFGVYSIATLLVLGCFLALVRLLYLPWIKRAAVVSCEALAIVFAFAVMVYTGLLLGTLNGVALWMSLWLPALFVASSASGGIALVTVCGVFVEKDADAVRMLHLLAICDIVMILAEAIFAVLFVSGIASSDNPGAVAGLAQLIEGPQALLWWVGFIGCGMVIPVLVEVMFCINKAADSDMLSRVFAIASVFVLMGVICMRIGVVDAGEQRELELQEVSAALELQDGSHALAEPISFSKKGDFDETEKAS